MADASATVLAGAEVQRPGERAVLGDPPIPAVAVVVGVFGGGGQGLRQQDEAGHLDAFQIPALLKASRHGPAHKGNNGGLCRLWGPSEEADLFRRGCKSAPQGGAAAHLQMSEEKK